MIYYLYNVCQHSGWIILRNTSLLLAIFVLLQPLLHVNSLLVAASNASILCFVRLKKICRHFAILKHANLPRFWEVDGKIQYRHWGWCDTIMLQIFPPAGKMHYLVYSHYIYGQNIITLHFKLIFQGRCVATKATIQPDKSVVVVQFTT